MAQVVRLFDEESDEDQDDALVAGTIAKSV